MQCKIPYPLFTARQSPFNSRYCTYKKRENISWMLVNRYQWQYICHLTCFLSIVQQVRWLTTAESMFPIAFGSDPLGDQLVHVLISACDHAHDGVLRTDVLDARLFSLLFQMRYLLIVSTTQNSSLLSEKNIKRAVASLFRVCFNCYFNLLYKLYGSLN